MLVNGEPVSFTLDTGSEVTILTEKVSKSLHLQLNKPTMLLVGANNKKLEVLGESTVDLTNKGKTVPTLVSVLKGAKRNLLGVAEIRKLNLLAVVNSLSTSTKKFDVFQEFSELFEGLGTMPEVFKINLRDDIKTFRLNAPRPIAAGLREKAQEEINKMLKMDVIEPVEQPTDWCSGLTIAPKPNGNIRMCVDLTMLNKGVQRELYPLPRVSDMLSQLSKGRLFSKLDANSGFWQVLLDEESRLLTTFITPWGRYCFKRMPFGISSAPEFYQRCMEKILSKSTPMFFLIFTED